MKLFTTLLICILLSGCATWKVDKSRYAPKLTSTGSSLHARFFGTSTISLSDGKTTLLFDGFFTRKAVGDMVDSGMVTDFGMVETALRRGKLLQSGVNGLFVGHAHFDHALDINSVTKLTGAKVYGSETVLKLTTSENTDRLVQGKRYPIGDFTVTAIESKHVKKTFLSRIAEAFYMWRAEGDDYKEKGTVFSFFVEHPKGNVLIIPSARFDAALPKNKQAPTVFMSVGLLSKRSKKEFKQYWQNAVINAGAKTVFPIHWDDFREPILVSDDIPPSPGWADNLTKTMNKLDRYAAKTQAAPIQIILPPAYRPFALNVE